MAGVGFGVASEILKKPELKLAKKVSDSASLIKTNLLSDLNLQSSINKFDLIQSKCESCKIAISSLQLFYKQHKDLLKKTK